MAKMWRSMTLSFVVGLTSVGFALEVGLQGRAAHDIHVDSKVALRHNVRKVVHEVPSSGSSWQPNVSAARHGSSTRMGSTASHGSAARHGSASSHGSAFGHGSAASHGSAGGHGHHDHDDDYSDPVTAAMGCMLFGTVAWVVSMFYFVNWPDPDIQVATWSTLSSMISIFCAVLLFSATTETLVDFAGLEVHHHGKPDVKTLSVGYMRWGLLLLLFQASMIGLREKPKQMVWLCNVGAHIVGFSAIEALGTTMHMPLFADSFQQACLGILLFTVLLAGLCLLMQFIRNRISTETSWREDCSEAESESVGLTLGLLYSMLIRYAIVGHLPAVHGEPKSKEPHEVWMLFSVSLALAPCVVGASILKRYVEKMAENFEIEIVSWLAGTFKETICMTMGWTLLYWGYWSYYLYSADYDGAGGKVGMRVTMAILFSALVFASIVGIDFVADMVENDQIEKGLRGLLKTFALLMGLSWEATFAVAVTAVGHQYKGHAATYVVDSLVVGLCALVLPAWALYILPHTYKEHDSGVLHKRSVSSKRHSDTGSVMLGKRSDCTEASEVAVAA